MLDSGPTCSTGAPVDTAAASAVVPTNPLKPATSGAATSNPDPVSPSVPRSVICGARNPRLTDPSTAHASFGVAIAAARNVTSETDSASSGHNGRAPVAGLSAARASYRAPP